MAGAKPRFCATFDVIIYYVRFYYLFTQGNDKGCTYFDLTLLLICFINVGGQWRGRSIESVCQAIGLHVGKIYYVYVYRLVFSFFLSHVKHLITQLTK